MKITYIVMAVIAVIVVLGAIALASVQNAERLAKLYYEKSTFTSGSETRLIGIIDNEGRILFGESLAHPDHTKPARPAHVADEVARAAVDKAGVSGRLLGTYIYNATHYVTLVDGGPLSAYAVIWNNETAAAVRLNFTKYIERSFNETVGEHSEYKFVRGWRYVGYVETSGALPFSVYKFYDESWGMWRTPTGYYKAAAAGWFTVVYGVAVYVTNASYYEVTDPMLRSCYLNSYTEGDGTPLAGVNAIGRAITTACPALGTVFEIIADVTHDAWLISSDSIRLNSVHGNKWFTETCAC